MKILFVGESWLGSCARSLREALSRHPEVELDELAEDHFFPKARSRVLRAAHRLLRPLHRQELNRQIMQKVRDGRPDCVVAYKGSPIHADLLSLLKSQGVKTVNVYPDCSPHAHGQAHREAMGKYDLVISTKAYHPGLWLDTYGYRNRCRFVPQGYDPHLHLVPEAPTAFEYDVVMVATYRAEYGQLMLDFAQSLGAAEPRVAIGGYGWDAVRDQLPDHWVFTGPVQGRGYIALLRSGKICLAPLTRNVVIHGQRQPGDVDTTRSYELAAAHCFFIHQRTEFAQALYGEEGVPMFDDGAELAAQVLHYLDRDKAREDIAAAAHRRAVPAYSLDARAQTIVEILKEEVN